MKFLTSLYQSPLVQTYMTEQANEVRLRNNPGLWPQTVDAALMELECPHQVQDNPILHSRNM